MSHPNVSSARRRHPLIPIQEDEVNASVHAIKQYIAANENLIPDMLSSSAAMDKKKQKKNNNNTGGTNHSSREDHPDKDSHGIIFVSVDLVEPWTSAQKLSCFQSSPCHDTMVNEYDRSSRTCIMIHDRQRAISVSAEIIVSLVTLRVVDWRWLPLGTQPFVTLEEFQICEKLVKGDPKFQAMMKRRGLVPREIAHDSNAIQKWADRRWMIEPWSAGFYGDEEERGYRLLRTIVFVRVGSDDDHGYAHPVEGVCLTLDLVNRVIVCIEDMYENSSEEELAKLLPKERINYEQHLFEQEGGKMRTDMKPIEITQPLGASFTVSDTNLISWQNWNLRVGFSALEGLTLHCLEFHKRPIAYRMSIAEMAVPYGDPTSIHSRKNAFDVGEYGLGKLANSLTLGCDCLGEIHYFDGCLTNMHGVPYKMKNVICLHEEDNSILWKHTDWRRDKVSVRRSRRLVISFIATVGNYEYGFYYHLYLDGAIELEIKHTGIINTSTLFSKHFVPSEDGTLKELKHYNPSKYATKLTNEGLCGQIHQHIYCARIDMCLDGVENRLVELNVQEEEDDEINYRGNGFYAQETLLAREMEARRKVNPNSNRCWKIVNQSRKNKVGDPVSYVLQPATNIRCYAKPHSWLVQRAPWLKYHLWCSQYDPSDSRHPSGNYVNQTDGTTGGDTIETITNKNRNIVDQDLVLWYTFGITHVVRLEDFPVMPVGPLKAFTLVPHGFFDMNPVLDVPPNKPMCCKL